MKDNKH